MYKSNLQKYEHILPVVAIISFRVQKLYACFNIISSGLETTFNYNIVTCKLS